MVAGVHCESSVLLWRQLVRPESLTSAHRGNSGRTAAADHKTEVLEQAADPPGVRTMIWASRAAPYLLNDLKAGGYKIVFMKPKYSVTTIASYDEVILKQLGPMPDSRPTSSVVRTISE